jgi:hypothetical protein
MSDTLTFRANNCGKLHISISTETVRVQTEWKNLTNPHREYLVSPFLPCQSSYCIS